MQLCCRVAIGMCCATMHKLEVSSESIVMQQARAMLLHCAAYWKGRQLATATAQNTTTS